MTVVALVTFSLTVIEAVGPPPLLVIDGASLVFVMVTAMVWSSEPPAAVARTITS